MNFLHEARPEAKIGERYVVNTGYPVKVADVVWEDGDIAILHINDATSTPKFMQEKTGNVSFLMWSRLKPIETGEGYYDRCINAMRKLIEWHAEAISSKTSYVNIKQKYGNTCPLCLAVEGNCHECPWVRITERQCQGSYNNSIKRICELNEWIQTYEAEKKEVEEAAKTKFEPFSFEVDSAELAEALYLFLNVSNNDFEKFMKSNQEFMANPDSLEKVLEVHDEKSIEWFEKIRPTNKRE